MLTFLHRLAMASLQPLPCPGAAQFSVFWSAKLIRKSIRTNKQRITRSQLKYVGMKDRLVPEDAASNGKPVPLDFIEHSLLQYPKWAMCAGVSNLSGCWIYPADGQVHPVARGPFVASLTQAACDTLIQQIQNLPRVGHLTASDDVIQEEESNHRQQRTWNSVPGAVDRGNKQLTVDLGKPRKVTTDNISGFV